MRCPYLLRGTSAVQGENGSSVSALGHECHDRHYEAKENGFEPERKTGGDYCSAFVCRTFDKDSPHNIILVCPFFVPPKILIFSLRNLSNSF